MSTDSMQVFCYGCDFSALELFQIQWLRYVRDDGQTMDCYGQSGWCYHCDDYRSIESIRPSLWRQTLQDYEIQRSALAGVIQRQTRQPWLRVWHYFSNQILRLNLQQLSNDIKRTQALLSFFATRVSAARCLTCGSAQTAEIRFSSVDQTSDNFVHHCGGRFRMIMDPNSIRIHSQPRVQWFSLEGGRLEEPLR